MKISEIIANRIKRSGDRFFSCDNISDHILEGELLELKRQLAISFDQVLRDLVIDVEGDPNSFDTAQRLAKMYIDEIFRGRYYPKPKINAFPNEGDDMYEGMLVVRADIKSVCSHHHKDVNGTAFIGIIPSGKVLGLSKYIRLAQWEARRGTLQEELCTRIAKTISKETESKDVAVYIEATHGCVSCRGVEQENSLTQTTVLLGGFKDDMKVREEFYHNISMQKAVR